MDRLKGILNSCSFKDVFVDLNIRLPFSTEDAVKFAVEKATMLKVSDEEMPFVANALGLTYADDYRIFAKELSDRFKNLKCIVVTLGARGAYALDVSKNIESSCEADKVALASTVGAGDSFSASFLDQYYKKPLELALKYASKIAGYVVSCYDAVPNYDPNDFL
jgi:fructokinase